MANSNVHPCITPFRSSGKSYLFDHKTYAQDCLPFSSCDNDEFLLTLKGIDNEEFSELYQNCMKLNNTFEMFTSDFVDGSNSNTEFQHSIVKNSYFSEEEFNEEFGKKDSHQSNLAIIQINARSLRANFTKLKLFLLQSKKEFDVISISETWLDDCDDLNLYQLENYTSYFCSRQGKAGGGVALYIGSQFQQKKLYDITVTDIFEFTCVEIVLNNCKKIVVGSLYRAPNSTYNLETFSEQIETIITSIKSKTLYLCGDFNIDILKSESNEKVSGFLDLMFSKGLYPLINRPTRVTPHSNTLIDNIYTSELNHQINSGIIVNDISDHLPVFTICNYGLTRENNNKCKIKRRIFNEDTIKNLNEDLSSTDWQAVYRGEDVNTSYNDFMRVLNEKIAVNCPFKSISCKNQPKTPWITKALLVSCKKKNQLYKKFLLKPTHNNELKYKDYKRILSTLLRKAEKLHYTQLLDINKKNAKETWKIINNITNKKRGKRHYPGEFISKNGKVCGDINIANLFNDFFVNVGPSLAKNIPTVNKSFIDYMPKVINTSLFLNPTDENEIINIVMAAKNKYSCGIDNISMNLVKSIIGYIVSPLMHIFNLSLHSGLFPDKMKIACVIPLYKAGDDQEVSNYRPVSLLPQFSKLLEKLFNQRLVAFIEVKRILYESQYGFRNKMSTSMAIFELIDNITSSIDNQDSTIGIFIDLKKAFDTIDHALLLKKLSHYGVRGVANEWLTSYLSERSQYVRFNNCESTCKYISCGVPQGSILGPTLFILYVNDMCNVSKLLKCILFADDTNLFFTGKNITEMCYTISEELAKLNTWFMVNKLSLNLKKTNFMVLSNSREKCDLRIAINNCEIERVHVAKFLGIYIDDNLNWHEHVKHVKRRMAIGLSVLNRLKHVVNSSAMYSLYCTIILPHLNYCSEIWGNTYNETIKPLSVMQKKAVRLVGSANNIYRDHSAPIFFKYNLLNVYDLIEYNSMCFMYKIYYKILPSNLQQRFNMAKDIHSHVTRQSNKFSIKYCRTKQRSFLMTIKGPKNWNNLPDVLKSCPSLHCFKSDYKRHLLLYYTH